MLQKISNAFIPSALLSLLMWIVKSYEARHGLDFGSYGVLPRTIDGLRGILFSPFIHGSYEHLYSNTIPLILLGTMICYFFEEIWLRVYSILFLISGVGLWLIGRENFHIGASGLVYGMAAFLFFAGMFHHDFKLKAISFIIVFLYGSLVWGMMPVLIKISWEGHLAGMVAGLITAYIYRNNGPKRLLYQWEHDEINDLLEGAEPKGDEFNS